jgi:hypothetical protein
MALHIAAAEVEAESETENLLVQLGASSFLV